jgi:hypothetical protein
MDYCKHLVAFFPESMLTVNLSSTNAGLMVLIALIVFFNLLNCGEHRLASIDPRRSTYFRRYIVVTTICGVSDLTAFATCLWLDVYGRGYLRDLDQIAYSQLPFPERLINNVLTHRISARKVFGLSLIFTYVICFSSLL